MLAPRATDAGTLEGLAVRLAARLAARRASRAARPRAHPAATPAAASGYASAPGNSIASASLPHCFQGVHGARSLTALARAGVAARSRTTVAHSGPRRPGGPLSGPAAAAGTPADASQAATQFELAAEHERLNEYNNSAGKQFATFGLFLTHALETAAAARAAQGLDVSAWQQARDDARRYGALRLPERSALMVTCRQLLSLPHEALKPLATSTLPAAAAAPTPAAAAAPAPAAQPTPDPPPPLPQRELQLGGLKGRKPSAVPAAAAPPAAPAAAAAPPAVGAAPAPAAPAAAVSPGAPPAASALPSRPRRAKPLSKRSVEAPAASTAAPAQTRSSTPLVVAFDLETTGLRPNSDRVIEVAVVNCETGDFFDTLVNPGRVRVPTSVTGITKINDKMVTAPNVPGFALAAERLELKVAEWAAKRHGGGSGPILLAAHNARRFDVRFLEAEYERAGRALPAAWQFVDTLTLAQALVRDVTSYRLEVLHTFFKLGHSDAHRAKADAQMVRNLLGPQALGRLDPDLPARLLRVAFTARVTAVAVAAETAAAATKKSPSRATPLPPPEEVQVLLESDEAEDLSVELDGADDFEDSGADADADAPRRAAPVRRPPVKKAPAYLPGRRASARPDPLQEQQAMFPGVRPSDAAPAELANDWHNTPLSQCLSAEDAALLAPTFANAEQLLRHYPSRFDEFQPFQAGLGDGASCVAMGVVQQVSADAAGEHWSLTLQTQDDGVCTAAIVGNGDGRDGASALLRTLKPGTLVSVRGCLAAGVLQASASDVLDLGRSSNGHLPRAGVVVPRVQALADEQGGELPVVRWEHVLSAALAAAEDAERSRGDWLACALDDAALLHRLGLISGLQALRSFHRPDCLADVVLARRRLAFEELLLSQVQLLRSRAALLGDKTAVSCTSTEAVDSAVKALASRGLRLTPPQRSALDDVLSDMASPAPMLRLLTGDSGCGKSVVAYLALLAAHDAGVRAMLSLPCAAVAEQHYARLRQLIKDAGIAPARQPRVLLMGSADAGSADADIVVGTHESLLSIIPAAPLGLFVADDEREFGEVQRAALRAAASHASAPHVLALYAVPLPRALALAAHGDSVISVIDAAPPGRGACASTETYAYDAGGAARAEAFVAARAAADAGSRACILCPDAQSAAALHAQLRAPGGALADLPVGLLCSGMSAADKAAALDAYVSGATSVLVATDEPELRVDVPNVGLLVVEGAEQFALAELHQLRSRVGRGKLKQGRCILLYDGAQPAATARLAALAQDSDGLRVAEEDLRLRGTPALALTSLVSLSNDAELLEEARAAAAKLLLRAREAGAPPHDALFHALAGQRGV